jgi:hypothetical protein
MKKFYFKLDGDIIQDVIEYEHTGYVQLELTESCLPAGINAGYYRLNGTIYSIDEELKIKIESVESDKPIPE